jgi:hypothetical protein
MRFFSKQKQDASTTTTRASGHLAARRRGFGRVVGQRVGPRRIMSWDQFYETPFQPKLIDKFLFSNFDTSVHPT